MKIRLKKDLTQTMAILIQGQSLWGFDYKLAKIRVFLRSNSSIGLVFHLENEAKHIEAGDRIKKAKLETYDKIRIMNGIAEVNLCFV